MHCSFEVMKICRAEDSISVKVRKVHTKLTFTCLKSTTETQGKGVKYVPRLTIKKHQNNVIDVVLLFLLLALTDFASFSSIYIVDFEQVNVSWDGIAIYHTC